MLIAGRDEWRNAALPISIGRTQPKPARLEDIAKQLSDAAVQRIERFYPQVARMRETAAGWIPAMVDCHPGPLCETVRFRRLRNETDRRLFGSRDDGKSLPLTENFALTFALN